MKNLNEASNPNTLHARLRELAKQSPELALVILQNPNTPIELAAQLRRQLTGKSPNEAPDAETLELLAREAHTQKDPTRLVWLSQFGGEVTRAVARNAHTPVETLHRFVQIPDSLLHCELLRNPAFEMAGLEKKASKKKNMQRAIAACSRASAESLLALASHANKKVVESVAQNPSMTLQGMIALWLNRKNRAVRLMESSVRQDPARAEYFAPWLEKLIGLARSVVWRFPSVQQALAQKSVPSKLRETLLQASRMPDFYVNEKQLTDIVAGRLDLDLLQMTKSYNTTQEYLTSQLDHPSATIRAQVAAHYRASPEMLTQLANDGDFSVRVAAARNAQTPVEVLVKLAREGQQEVLLAVAQSYRLPPTELDALVTSMHTSVRVSLAMSRQISAQTVLRLCRDTALAVRQKLLERAMLSAEDLRILAQDLEPSVRAQVARRVGSLPSVLALLARDTQVSIRREVARKARASEETLALLGKDRSKHVRLEVAKNKSARLRTLQRLSQDHELEVAQAAQETLQKTKERV
jgi:hypothetical protein